MTKGRLKQLQGMCNITLTREEEQGMIADLDQILKWIDQLKALPKCSSIAMDHSISGATNRITADMAVIDLQAHDLLRQAPVHDTDYFHVPSERV